MNPIESCTQPLSAGRVRLTYGAHKVPYLVLLPGGARG
jgi:hypothetical protein